VPDINPSTGNRYGLPDFSWHFPSPPNAGQGGNPGGKGGCGGTGPHPVNYSTGIKVETFTDIAFGGARGGLALTRYYTSDNSARNFSGHFGRGVHDNYEMALIGTWVVGGSGRVIEPDEETGRLFSYARTDSDGAIVFTASSTVSQLGDVVRKLTNGALEYRYVNGVVKRFDSSGRMTAVVDQNGNTTTLTYTGSRLTSVTDPVGRSLTFNYNASGFVSIVTDPIGRVWSYTYGTFGAFGGHLATVTDPLGHTTSYTYANARLTSITDPRGNVAKTITYDGNGRVIRQQFVDGGFETYDYVVSGGIVTATTITDPLGRRMTKRFNASGYILGSVDALGQSSLTTLDLTTNLATATVGPCGCPEETRQFDGRGNLTAATDQLGHTMSYEYEPAFNNVTRTVDKNGNITTFHYDAHGNLTSFTNPLNETVTFEIDANGQVTGVTDPLGHETHMEYDSSGNMMARIDPLGHRWVMEYDALGRLTATVDPLGRRLVTGYDVLDRVKKITDASGAVTTYAYDANGNQTKVTDGLNHVWTLVYDSKNRLTSQTDPLGRGTRLTYNPDDELSQVISPTGRKTLYEYDSRGQRTSTTYPLGERVRFAYDNRGNLERIIDQRGHTTTWTYDEQFRPKTMRDPLGKISSLAYDSQSNVTTKVDKLGRQTTLAYDALNRVRQIVYPDAQVNYIYDHAGRLQTINDTQGGEVSYAYDDSNRPISETTAAGVVNYEYDLANQRSKMTPTNRLPVTYGYDSAGRLQAITQEAKTFSFEYDALSRRKSLTRPNGIVTNYEYDAVHRLKRLTHALGQQAIEDYQYEYTLDDEISSITSLSLGTVLAQQRNASAADPTNRISQFGDASYTFDDQGQMLTRADSNGTTSYGWDARRRLTQATLPNAQSVSYSYDAFGRRTSSTSNNVTTSFLYDGQEVILDQGSDGSATDYLNGFAADEKLRQANSNTGALYFLQDHLGSTVALTNAAGSIAERTQYEAFGQSTGSSLTPYGFTGREREAATGLMYYRARWYDPHQGRFMSEDPVGLNARPNLYEYAYDNPLRYVDPTGNQGLELAGALAGGGSLAAGGTSAGGAAASGAAAGGAAASGAAAILPPVAVAIAGAAAIYGAWKFGEWIADQPWNPLTHPAPPPAPPTCPTRAVLRPNPIPIPFPPPPMPAKPCPPCPAPPPPQIHRVPPSTPHFPCPGDHWHYFVYNQNPVTCQCYLQRKFGGCCGTPGAPC
jgi:RHS repeat-associated protein